MNDPGSKRIAQESIILLAWYWISFACRYAEEYHGQPGRYHFEVVVIREIRKFLHLGYARTGDWRKVEGSESAAENFSMTQKRLA